MRARAIVWTEGRHTTEGVVGGVRLFSFTYMGGRGADAKPWTLTTELPGYGRYQCGDAEVCKRQAERTLTLFLGRITEPEPSPVAALAVRDGWPACRCGSVFPTEGMREQHLAAHSREPGHAPDGRAKA